MPRVLLLVAVGLLIAADEPKKGDKATDELGGNWAGKSAKTSAKSSLFSEIWEFTNDKIVIARGEGKASEWKYHFDPKKTPKEIDLTPDGGPTAGKTLKGIYKVEGGTLTICSVRPNVEQPEKKHRPMAFDITEREDVVILTFERKKP